MLHNAAKLRYKDRTFGAAEHRREAPLTEQQQQACVSAPATVALLRYICRRDEANAQSRARDAQKFGYGQIGPLTQQQQEACVSAPATVALLRYICRRDEANARWNEQYGYGGDIVSAKQQAR